MTRLGINVPEKLMKRIKPFRGSINVSQVCRDALEAHVAAHERAKARAEQDDLGDVIRRFRDQHVDIQVDWERLGHEDAKLWVELASLKDLEELFYRVGFKMKGSLAGPLETEIVPFLEGVKKFHQHWQENEDWVNAQYSRDLEGNHYGSAKAIYDRAWFGYTTAVWGSVRDAIATEKAGGGKSDGAAVG